MSDTRGEIVSRLEEALGEALGAPDSFNQVEELTATMKWFLRYKGARENHEEVRLRLVNALVEKLLSSLHVDFIQFTFDKAVQKKSDAGGGYGGDLVVSLPSIPSNIYLVVVIDDVPTKDVLKVSFVMDSEVSFKGLRVVSDGTRHLTAKSMGATITLYVTADMRFRQKKVKVKQVTFSRPVENFDLPENEIGSAG